MIHLMLGRTFEGAIRNLMGYVLSYEDKDLSDNFTGMLCSRETDGSLTFSTAQRVTENENLIQFNTEPDDPFKVELCQDIAIGTQDQLAHLKNYFSRLFDKRVTINKKSREAVLNVCIYLPMYDEEEWDLAKLLIKAISEQNRNIKVDLFMFSSDLAYLFTPEEQQEDLAVDIINYQRSGRSILKEVINFKESSQEATKFEHVIVMQNCNAGGLSLDLDWDSFVRVIGEYAIATMNSYSVIFNPNAEIDGRPIHSFGLCVLNLDKYYYVKYLLSKAYVTILEREGVNQDEVDVNGPSQIVQRALTADNERYKFYDYFYEYRVKGYISDGKSEDEINAQALNDIDNDIANLVNNITAFLNDDSLSLPTKRVTLAQLLGMDDELMTGDMFNPEQLLFRDTYADCIDMFVRANNLLTKKSPTDIYVEIPESTDFVRSDYPENFKDYAALSDEEIDFSGICKELKSDEVKIRRQTEYIRTLEKELLGCEVQHKQSEEKEKVLTKDGFRYRGEKYRLEPIENIPLDKTYVPRNVALPKSLDLRKLFTPVKNQGPIGSCTIFTLASIFEYILGKGSEKGLDLSERYLYYNTRIETLHRKNLPETEIEETGASFFDAITSLQRDGICVEPLFPYTFDKTDINAKPSIEAYSDGRTRLVTEAMNVELSEQALKSALNDGYPVAISVRLFESFGHPDHGFISIPDPEEVRQADEDEIENNHAMVICGYSDETKVFVVRNSWGTEFGDNGYCYMPYSYITDSHLTNQACIITSTNVVSAKDITDTGLSREIVPFDKYNPEINAAIIKVLIAEARLEKTRLVNHRMDLYKVYSAIEKRLVNPEVRSALTTGTKARLEWELGVIHKQMDENQECEDKRIRSLDRHNRNSIIIFSTAVVLLVALCIIFTKVEFFKTVEFFVKYLPGPTVIKGTLSLIGIMLIIASVRWFVYFKQRKAVRAEHREVSKILEEEEHDRKNGGLKNKGNLGLYEKALGIRMFMPWLVIRKLSENNRLLEQKYQVMVNYTLNLREWYETEKIKVAGMSSDTKEPFISLLSNETLDEYYKSHANEITKGIRLSELFRDGYTIDDSVIVKFQNKLKNRIINVLDNSLKDFTVYKYLTDTSDFEFAKARERDIHDTLRTLEDKSEVFIRLGTSPATSESVNSTTTVLMSCDIIGDIDNWNRSFQKDFSNRVNHVAIMSPFKLSFLQMKRLPLEECLDLYDADVVI